MKKTFITQFNETGPCEVDIEKVAKVWTDKFSLIQYHEDYTLLKYGKGERPLMKVQVSETQAKEIIEKMNLLKVQNSVFVHGAEYKTREFINKELARLNKIKTDKEFEIEVISKVLKTLRTALA